MKHVITCICFILCFYVVPVAAAPEETGTPDMGRLLEGIELKIPENPSHQTYLGVTGTGIFHVSQIKTQVVIIEIFNMYCPHCQRHAPSVNRLYKTINEGNLKDKIKVIGIAVGNSPYEVNYFKQTYSIPFPLFSDADWTIHNKLGQIKTPFFIALRISPDNTLHTVYSKPGGFDDPGRFLDMISKRSGLK